MAKKSSKQVILGMPERKNNNKIKHESNKIPNNIKSKNYKTAKEVLKARQKILDKRKKTIEKHRSHHEKPKEKFNWKKWSLIALFIIALIFAWKVIDIPGKITWVLQQNPTVWSAYQSIMAEVEARTLIGLAYASFFGSLFFISLPVEAIFVYYLGLNYYVVQIITIVMLGNILGMIINYGFGWLIGERVVKFFMKKNYHSFRKKLDRAGSFLILLGNIIPFPIEPFAVFLGAVKYKFRWYIFYTIIGKLIKFILLSIGYAFFIKFAAPHLEGITIEWFIERTKDIFTFW